MEELIKTIKQYKGIAINASAVLMFIFFGFGSVLDVMGKVQMNGLNLLFKGSRLGFHWFLALLILLVPILIVLGKSVKLKFTGKMNENYYTIYNPQNEMLAFCKTKCSIRKTKRIFLRVPSYTKL